MSGWFSKKCNPRYHDREAALGHLGKPAMLHCLLGWTRTELPRENAFSTEHEVGRGRGSVIPSETVQAALRNLSALDFLLHDHAMVRFEADLVLAAG